ncbi:nucleoside-binding protein [Tindallia magadiensis]|uniref:Nucleoside-binding protein n=1 Tax=Tindallia magadiensis TaxID=69895 RepID=A0A1I3AQG3_9FIRM|nr:BMP family ABC transporter substrate-binding protein [Tindallia magadiensis]SFH52398.1 nucleoside-binding protein [Tindallia magadiensis]
MKKYGSVLLMIVLILSLALTGCGGSDEPAEPAEPTDTDESVENGEEVEPSDDELDIVLLINGTLGDRSFFDSAHNGMQLIEQELGANVRTIEMSYDQTSWEPTLWDVSEQDWDIIVLGTWQMQEFLEEVAPEFPDNRYIIFDTSVDYSLGGLDNVYSIQYKQNEGAFLAGVLAAHVTGSDMEYADNSQNMIGFLGGMDIPVINDFLVGYIDGALYVDEDIKVYVSYIGDFSDSPRGKEMALAQYNDGVDIGFNVAGQAGLGQIDAAAEVGRYAIGVDSDQAMVFAETDPEKAAFVLTSMLKRVDNSILRAVEMHLEGTLPYGEAEALGIKEEAVGLANNDFYQENVDQELRDYIKEIEDLIDSGEITVRSALGMSTEELDEIRDSVSP